MSPEPNQADQELLAAAAAGDAGKVRRLLAKGADPNCENKAKKRPIMFAAANGHIDILKLLLEKGADPDVWIGHTNPPLLVAAKTGNLEMAGLLLKHGASVDLRGGGNMTPLECAAINGCADMARLLAGAPGAPRASQEVLNSTLIPAAGKGHVDLLRLLIRDCKADPNGRNAAGHTALMAAAVRGQVEAARFLLECGADPDAATKDGRTALELAKMEGHIGILELLEPKRAAEPAKTPGTAKPSHQSSGRGRVLLIDDDEYLTEAWAERLDLDGFEARTAPTGRDGLAAAAEFQPDIAVVDRNLPDMCGFELCERLRGLCPGILLFVITGGLFWGERTTREELRLRAKQCGAHSLIIKPFDIAEMGKLFRDLLERKRAGLGPPDPSAGGEAA